MQALVADFYVRDRKLNVIFEPGTKKFSYKIYGNTVTASDASSTTVLKSDTASHGFFRSKSSLMYKNMNSETQLKLQEQDRDLDEIHGVLGDLNGMATAMGNEIDRQSDQLDRVTDKVDTANATLKKTNQRIQKLL